MTEPTREVTPQTQEQANEASAGPPQASGPDATRAAMASPEAFRLNEDELNERDARFSRPRKEQGPPLSGPDRDESARAEEAETVEETPIPPAPG